MSNKITIEQFGADLADEIKRRMEDKVKKPVSVELADKIKTNVKSMGIVARVSGERAAPSVDIEDAFKMYQNGGISLESIAQQMTNRIISARNPQIKIPEITVEEARRHITLSVINAARNKELLENTPHYNLGDLAVIPRWMISDEASFVVNEIIAQKLGLTKDEILQMGQENINKTTFKVDHIGNVLADILGANPINEDAPGLYVLTNQSTIDGSNVLLSRETLKMVHKELGGDIVLIPSSRHEILAMKIVDDMDPDQLRHIVREINESTVSEEDYLGDNIFMYDGKKLTMVGPSFKTETEMPEMQDDSPSIHFGM